jgi:hypothetical protein
MDIQKDRIQRRRTPLASRCTCALALSLCAVSAYGGNEDTYLFGDHAALMAGAVVPTATGTAATWYNPAGLGGNDRGKLELSGTAFMLQLRRIPEMLRVTYPGGEDRQAIQSTRIYIVPSSLVWVRRLTKRLSLGLGVFVTEQDLYRFNGNIRRAPGSPGLELDMAGQLSGTVLRYHLGGSLGLLLTPRVRLGGSLFLVYEKNNEFRKLFADAASDGAYQSTFLQRLVDAETSRFSLEAVLGLQWQVASRWHVGAVVRSPRITFSETAATDNSTSIVSRGASVPDVIVTNIDHTLLGSTGTGPTMPPRFVLGATRKTARTELSLEADVRPPIFNQLKADRWTVNGRAGLLLGLNATNMLGMGLFTDQSGQAAPRVFPDYRVDYYGATFGWRRLSTVKLHATERTSTLVFSTTVALRYALGIGDSTTLRFDYTNTGATGLVERIDNERVGVLFHEVSLYLGTSLEF